MRAARHFLALAMALLLFGCSGEEIEIETGYRGKARRDPFLAAERLLEENRYHVSTHTWLGDNLPDGATLIATAPSIGNRGTTENVLDWVSGGGHLELLLGGGDLLLQAGVEFGEGDFFHGKRVGRTSGN